MVTVCFLHVGPIKGYERLFVASVLKSMPHARVIQFTDMTTPMINTYTQIRRSVIKEPLWVHRWRAYSELDGPVICLDTDVIVRKDLSIVFTLDWDVALTRRDKPVWDPDNNDITKTMPFNGGVLLSRSRRWLKRLADTCEEMTPLGQEWYTDQLAMTVCVKSQPERCLHLPCELYNFTPQRREDSIEHAWVVHYKGNRKEWMYDERGTGRPRGEGEGVARAGADAGHSGDRQESRA